MRLSSILLSGALSLVALPAAAHQPSFAAGNETGPDTAFTVPDLAISRVVYVDMACPAPPFWLTFDAEAGESLFLQLGVPVMDALETHRPTLVLLGPGLPDAERSFPFEIPAGLGALTFPTDDVSEPETFYEPFTQTTSWILLETTRTLDTAGTYYVVAYDEEPVHGRLWVATGTEEVFGGDLDLARLKDFHDESTAPDLGQSCEGEGNGAPQGEDEGCSCRAAGQGGNAAAPGLFAAFALAALGKRRRRSLPSPP